MRRGFTLIEILVSIAIFVVAATIMLGALFGSTEVFRRGEAARQAGDEATAVLAALQEDLSRATPIRLRDGKPASEWGRMVAEVSDNSGNCLLALVVENPDRAQIRWTPNPTDPARKLIGVRKRVVWYVRPSSTATAATVADSELVREEWDITEDGTAIDTSGASVAWPTDAARTPLRRDVVTTGCLHFSVWAEMAQAHRTAVAGAAGPEFGWEADTVLPYGQTATDPAMALNTNVTVSGTTTFYPQPDALRVMLVLTGGGRFATRGTLIQASGTDWRISGIKSLPTIYGSLLRVGDEWIRYDDFRGGMLRGVQDQQLRSQAGGRNRGDIVFAGQPFSLVVALPR